MASDARRVEQRLADHCVTAIEVRRWHDDLVGQCSRLVLAGCFAQVVEERSPARVVGRERRRGHPFHAAAIDRIQQLVELPVLERRPVCCVTDRVARAPNAVRGGLLEGMASRAGERVAVRVTLEVERFSRNGASRLATPEDTLKAKQNCN